MTSAPVRLYYYLASLHCPVDHKVHDDIARAMSAFGGSFGNYNNYKFGPINSIVYPVFGGMEDWMYASAWDKSSLHACKSSNLRVNSEESDGRAAVFLVETSDEKQPKLGALGTMTHALEESPTGHVPRNIRLGLVAIDAAQPYVCFAKRVAVKRASNRRNEDRRVETEAPSFELKVKWYVGGAFTTDQSFLAWHRPLLPWTDLVEHGADWRYLLGSFPADDSEIPGTRVSGKARWTFPEPLDPRVFTKVIKVRSSQGNSSSVVDSEVTLLPPGDHWLVAWASVDQSWGQNDQVINHTVKFFSENFEGSSFRFSSKSCFKCTHKSSVERDDIRES